MEIIISGLAESLAILTFPYSGKSWLIKSSIHYLISIHKH